MTISHERDDQTLNVKLKAQGHRGELIQGLPLVGSVVGPLLARDEVTACQGVPPPTVTPGDLIRLCGVEQS